MNKIIDRLVNEPVAVRAALAAVLNLLVVTHVIDTVLGDAIDQTIAALAAVLLIADARAKVTPETKSSTRATNAYINAYGLGVRHGRQAADK